MKIVYITDVDISGSGYMNLSIPLCLGMVQAGHDVKVIGWNYKGEEHYFPFSIIPAQRLEEAFQILTKLVAYNMVNVLIVALDIPIQEKFLAGIKDFKKFKYVGIMPIEADPLTLSYAMVLLQMDAQLIISEFGTEEAHKAGVATAKHLPIGVDTEAWRVPSPEERKMLRDNLGIKDDEFLVLTVADNQERKNLSAAIETFAGFNKIHPNSKYVIVTRVNLQVGWKLQDLLIKHGISDKVILLERGMDFVRLWGIYAASDCFLSSAKAEGLSMCVLEAQAVGIPVVGTDCTAIHEHLLDDEHNVVRGILVEPAYKYVDPFGNGNRYFFDVGLGTAWLEYVYNRHRSKEMETLFSNMIAESLAYVHNKTWDKPVDILNRTIEDVMK